MSLQGPEPQLILQKESKNTQTNPQTSKILKPNPNLQEGCRALAPAAQPHREASPRPAVLARQMRQVAQGSHSFLVPHHRASAEHSQCTELQINAVDASAIPSGISTCWSNLHGDETWKGRAMLRESDIIYYCQLQGNSSSLQACITLEHDYY